MVTEGMGVTTALSPSQPEPAALPGAARFDFHATGGDALYRVFVHAPEGEAPPDGWPVLYMTDGNAVFATAVDALRAQSLYPRGTNVEPGLIVAIGYPGDAPYDSLRRSWDLSPPPGKAYPPFREGGPEVRTGGADRFLGFIEDDLKPWLASRYPVDPARQTLFGHSFGGLFALYALFTHPGAFDAWVSASPAIYWEDGLIDRYRAGFENRPADGRKLRVRLSAGEYEGDRLAPFQTGLADAAERKARKEAAQTVALAERLAEHLAALPAVDADFELYAGETHMSVLPVAVNRAVQTAFALSPAAS